MKKCYSLSVVFILFIILTQCQSPLDYKVFEDFPLTVELKHKPINIETPVMYPSGIIFIDSALVVLDISGDYFLNFFTLDDFAEKAQRVRRGRGPLEEESVFGLFKSPGKNEFWYMTHSGIRIARFINEREELEYLGFIPACDSFQGVTLLMGDKILGIPHITESTEFVKIFPEKCSIIDFGPSFPDVGKTLSIKEKSYLLGTKAITFKPDGSFFAASYHDFPILRIFHASDGSVKSDVRYLNNQVFPTAKINENATPQERLSTTTNYFVSHSTNSFIYSTYSGKSLLEIQPGILEEGFQITDFTNEIHVFDWNGKPVRRILLDKKIFAFAVSPDDKILVTLTMSEPDLLQVYKLQPEL